MIRTARELDVGDGVTIHIADTLELLDGLQVPDKDLLVVGNAGHLMGLEKLSHRRVDRAIADWVLGHAVA